MNGNENNPKMAASGTTSVAQFFTPSLSWEDKALCKQAHWFLYSPTHPPINTFRDGTFSEMLKEMIPEGFLKEGEKAPILTIEMLKKYIYAEYALMCSEIRSLIAAKHKASRGNTYAQLLHDGATLKNGSKVQAIGMELLDLNYRANFVICLCCRESNKNKGKDVADLCKSVSIEICGMDLSQICGIAKQDRAALTVPGYLDMDEKESCDMHDGDKIGKSAIGDLTRSKGKIGVNPFPAGVKLSLKFQNVAKYFKSTLENRNNYKKIVDDDDNLPVCGIKRDLSGTRIQARYLLFLSSLRIKKAIRMYEAKHEPNSFPTEGEWKSAREVEGVLRCAKPIVMFSQYETKLLGAYGPVVKRLVYKNLSAKSIELVNHEAWGVQKKPPRTLVDVDSFTSIGKTVLQRAKLEFER